MRERESEEELTVLVVFDRFSLSSFFSSWSLAIFAPSLIFSSFTLNLLNIFPLHFHPLLLHYIYQNVTKRSYLSRLLNDQLLHF